MDIAYAFVIIRLGKLLNEQKKHTNKVHWLTVDAVSATNTQTLR